MKVVLQRVKSAKAEVEGKITGEIEKGYLLLVGFEKGDDDSLLVPMVNKIKNIKLFPDESGRFAFSLEEIAGECLIVSQFTLSAELKKGKKPSFSKSMDPVNAEIAYEKFVTVFQKTGLKIQTGCFGAMMDITLLNDGPVTIILDSEKDIGKSRKK